MLKHKFLKILKIQIQPNTYYWIMCTKQVPGHKEDNKYIWKLNKKCPSSVVTYLFEALVEGMQ